MRRISKLAEIGDRPPDTDVCIISDGAVGDAVTRRFLEDERPAALIDVSSEPIDVPVRQGGPTDLSTLDDAGMDHATTVIVATSSDSRNLLAAQLTRTRFDVGRVLVLVNNPERVDAFTEAGHDPICAATALANAIVDHA